MSMNDRLSQSAHRLASMAKDRFSSGDPYHLEVNTDVMSARKLLDFHGIDAASLDPAALRERRYGVHVVIDCATRCIIGIHVESFPRTEVSVGSHRHVFKRVGYRQDLDAISYVS